MVRVVEKEGAWRAGGGDGGGMQQRHGWLYKDDEVMSSAWKIYIIPYHTRAVHYAKNKKSLVQRETCSYGLV